MCSNEDVFDQLVFFHAAFMFSIRVVLHTIHSASAYHRLIENERDAEGE